MNISQCVTAAAGRATNSEINGISFYGVGAGTTVDHVEVMSNYDDAMEFFGGNVNLKYVCNSFCDDDQVDIDPGLQRKNAVCVFR